MGRSCSRWSKISSSGKGGGGATKNPPPETNEKEKNTKPHLTKRGNSNVLAQGAFVRVLTDI